MKRVAILLICMVFFSSMLSAQSYSFSASAGISTMQLNELTAYQQELIDNSIVSLRGLSFFPAYSYTNLSFENAVLDKWRLGGTLGYATTGAHANYSDYSGYLNIDQNLFTFHLGLTGYYSLFTSKSWELSLMGNLSLTHTRVKVSKYIITARLSEENSLLLTSFSPSGLGGIELMYHFETVSLGLEAGYLANLSTEIKPANTLNFSSTELEPSGIVRANSSGLRAGLKIVFPITGLSPKSDPSQTN
jgi:hypothetical protein